MARNQCADRHQSGGRWRRRALRLIGGIVGIVAGLISIGTLPAPAAQDPIATPGQIDQIEFVQSASVKIDGAPWTIDYYLNQAYPCSLKGHQTFVVAYPSDLAKSTNRPLWVKMHGGGVGWFDASEKPQPDGGLMREESLTSLSTNLGSQTGLWAKIRHDPAGFRILAVSMCDRDLYGGGDQPDPNNPTGATTNGFYATKAAVQYTMAHYPTSKYFVYGSSAGAVGAFFVSFGLQRQGIAPAGMIADSGVPNFDFFKQVVNSIHTTGQPAYCRSSVDELAARNVAVPKRILPEWTEPQYSFDHLIATGQFTVPMVQLWNEGDPKSCRGVEEKNHMDCSLPDGQTVEMGASDCHHWSIAEAIRARGGPSINLRVCVTTPNAGNYLCNKHVLCGIDGVNTDTSDGMPADYNATIAQWVDARLAASPGAQ